MKPSAQPFLWKSVAILARHMLWFNFILGLNFIFLFFKFIIIHYHTQKQRKTIVEISFICLRKKNPFHTKGWAPNLVLIQRPGGTQKWPIHFFSVVFVAVKFDWSDRSFLLGSKYGTLKMNIQEHRKKIYMRVTRFNPFWVSSLH